MVSRFLVRERETDHRAAFQVTEPDGKQRCVGHITSGQAAKRYNLACNHLAHTAHAESDRYIACIHPY